MFAKPINVDLSWEVFCGIHWRAISQEVLMNLIRSMCLEITLLKLTNTFPRNQYKECLHMAEQWYVISLICENIICETDAYFGV